MANITLLPSAKVPLIYDGELTMTTEWYRFFWNIYGFTGTGVVPVDKGGTGLNTIGEHQLIIGNANNVFEPAELRGFGVNVTYDPGFVNLSLGASGVTPGTYGDEATVGQFTINEYGVITFADNVPIAIDADQIISGAIDPARISGSYTGITGVGTLTAGTWNATTIDTAYGGTGLTSFTSGGALYATSTTALTSGTLPVTAGGTGQSTYTNGQLLIGDTAGNTLTKATLTAGAGITITNGPGSITITGTGATSVTSYVYTATQGQTVFTGITYLPGNNGLNVFVNGSKQVASVNYLETNSTTVTFTSGLNVGDIVELDVIAVASGLSGVTAITATAPIVSTGGSTPNLSMPAATSSVNGYLTSTDWSTFNSKAPATSGTSILYGNGTGGFSNVTIGSGISFAGGTLSATGSGGTVTSVAALTLGTTGTDLSSTVANGTTTPVITLNVPTASAANRGALSAADWSTFNGKQAALVSGTNIKTVGGVSLLGSGDVGIIGATYGGTGQSSYVVGDILYASTTTALSKLADVATGNALISGGVGVAPSYGKIGLTT